MNKKSFNRIAVVAGIVSILYAAGISIERGTKEDKGASMQKNKWIEFDLDNVPGETPASLFGGLQQGQAILKYRLELRYPFDGKVGFYGGSDREQVNEECSNKKDLDIYCEEKNETAYLFRTTDDGKSFTKESFGHGIAQEIKEIGGVYFLKVFEADTWGSRTYRSDDAGRSWREIGRFYIDSLFGAERFIYVAVKSLSQSEREYSYFYTKDGGKTARQIIGELKELYENYPHTVHNGKLLFFKDGEIIYYDMDREEKRSLTVKIPKDKIVRTIHTDKETNEVYLTLLNSDAKKRDRYRTSIYYPKSGTHVEFTKSSKELDGKDLFLEVDGEYIGGFMRVSGVLFHFWTLDRGKSWQMESLKNYFFDDAFTGYGNYRIYMVAIVVNKKGVKRGTYLIMGKIVH